MPGAWYQAPLYHALQTTDQWEVERFWRTLNEDLIEGTDFESIDNFKKKLLEYMIYYNEFRPHSSLSGMTPKKFTDNLSTK